MEKQVKEKEEKEEKEIEKEMKKKKNKKAKKLETASKKNVGNHRLMSDRQNRQTDKQKDRQTATLTNRQTHRSRIVKQFAFCLWENKLMDAKLNRGGPFRHTAFFCIFSISLYFICSHLSLIFGFSLSYQTFGQKTLTSTPLHIMGVYVHNQMVSDSRFS